MKVKEEIEKVGLKLNIQKTKIMASSPITSWQIDGETVETMADFFFLGSKIQMVIAAMKLKDTYSLELCIQMSISFLFSFAFCFPSFHSYMQVRKQQLELDME